MEEKKVSDLEETIIEMENFCDQMQIVLEMIQKQIGRLRKGINKSQEENKEKNYLWIFKTKSSNENGIVGAIIIISRDEEEVKRLFDEYFQKCTEADPFYYKWKGKTISFEGIDKDDNSSDYIFVEKFELIRTVQPSIILWPYRYEYGSST
jgi:hypothetical protein